MRIPLKFRLLAMAGAASLAMMATPSFASNINAVFYAEVTTLDPHFAATYNTRNFGYLVFDTLFGVDSKGEIKPQMLDSYAVSDDGMTYTFKLRDGLKFHDGEAVTSKDVVSSLKRWGSRDALGRRLMAKTGSIDVVDDKQFKLVLKEKFGLVIEALAKPSSIVPFIMPERLAKTPGTEKLTEVVGSGPFKFRPDLYRQGDRIVVEKNQDYVPRSEPADFLSGGKVVKVDTLTLRVIPDGGTAVSALASGEIDYLENASFDLLPLLESDPNIDILNLKGAQMAVASFVLNHKSKPFDDPAIRQIMWKAVDQERIQQALGIPAAYGEVCKSYFLCGTPLSSTAGTDVATPSVEAAREALKKTSYNNEPVIIMQATDIASAKVGTEVLADTLRQIGFNVELQSTDWGSILARRSKPEGWSLYASQSGGFDLSFPLTNFFIGNNCTEYPGWYCQEGMGELLSKFELAGTQEERKAIADDIHGLAYQDAGWVMFATFSQPNAYRTSLKGLIPSSIPVFWNVEKSGD